MERWEREIKEETELGRAYLEYYDKIGGGPIGLHITLGYPEGIENEEDIIRVYKECIEKGITWEKLLNFKTRTDVDY